MIFMDFGLQNGAILAIFNPMPGPFLPTWAPPCAKIAPGWFPDLIFHTFGPFLDVFGAYFEGFGLDFGAFKNLQKMPKTC